MSHCLRGRDGGGDDDVVDDLLGGPKKILDANFTFVGVEPELVPGPPFLLSPSTLLSTLGFPLRGEPRRLIRPIGLENGNIPLPYSTLIAGKYQTVTTTWALSPRACEEIDVALVRRPNG